MRAAPPEGGSPPSALSDRLRAAWSATGKADRIAANASLMRITG